MQATKGHVTFFAAKESLSEVPAALNKYLFGMDRQRRKSELTLNPSLGKRGTCQSRHHRLLVVRQRIACQNIVESNPIA